MSSTFEYPFAPVKQVHQCLHAFHIPANNRNDFVGAYHYCSHARDGLYQCLIYDSTEPDAKLLGVEYMINEERFQALPPSEKPYWHSHKHEVLSGQLAAVGMTGAMGAVAQTASKTTVSGGLPDALEKRPMQDIYQTYGKAIHLWHPAHLDLPYGPPQLMMSNVEPEKCPPPAGLDGAIKERDRQLCINTESKREAREKYINGNFQTDLAADQWLTAGRAPVLETQFIRWKHPAADHSEEDCEKFRGLPPEFIPLECQEKLRCC